MRRAPARDQADLAELTNASIPVGSGSLHDDDLAVEKMRNVMFDPCHRDLG